jgi:hypothetical protein
MRLDEPDFELSKSSTGKDYNGTNSKEKEKRKTGVAS